MSKIIIFSAPSGAGKTTIVQHLLQKFPKELAFSVSACTRAPRPNEVNGKDYYFLSPEDFKKRIEENAFAEWEEVYENMLYGTLKSEIEKLWALGKTILFDVDVKGGLQLKKTYPHNSLAVFVKPPSIETLIERLKQRRTENEAQLQRRIARMREEMQYEPQFDHIILNKNLEEAFAEAIALTQNFLGS